MLRKIKFPNYIPLMEFLEVPTHFVAILGHSHMDRGMILSEYNTRCIRKDEIHELVLLKEAEDGSVEFKDAWYLGFIVFEQSAVIAKGMSFKIHDKVIGTLVGFDTTHEPNHYNILVSTPQPMTGPELGITLGDGCIISMDKKA